MDYDESRRGYEGKSKRPENTLRMDYYESRRGYKGKSKRTKYTLRMQRARVVDRIWSSIENVRKFSRNVLVNKLLCEYIAEYFQVVAKILEGFGLKKDFVGGQVFDVGPISEIDVTFDEKHFSDIAEAFDHRVGGGHKIPSDSKRKVWDSTWHPNMGSIEKDYPMETICTELDSFLLGLLDVLQEGENFVSFHSGLQAVNNAVVERTGLYGEKFANICERLHVLLYTFNMELRFETTHSLKLMLLQQYLDSNCLGDTSQLCIDFQWTLNVELATSLATMLERPYCVPIHTLQLKDLFQPSSLKASECRLRIFYALSKCMSLSKLVLINSMDEVLWHQFGCGLVNHSLKTLELRDTVYSLEGVAGVGEMLSGNPTVEVLIIRCSSLIMERMWDLLRSLTHYDGDLDVNTTLKRLEIHLDSIMFPYEERFAAQAVAQMLRTNKTLVHFSMPGSFSPIHVCEIVGSLRNNKTLEMLDLHLRSNFNRPGVSRSDNELVKEVFMDVLVKYNFTLKTIIWEESQERTIESFIKTNLNHTYKGGWTGSGYSSEFPQWVFQHEVDFLKQDDKSLQLEKSEGSNSVVPGYQEESKAEEDGCSLGFPPKHNIILSFYEEEEDFAQQLYRCFKSSHCRVFLIQDPDQDLTKVVEQCELAIVVLSDGYLTSERCMQELHTFMNFKNSDNQPLKVLPLLKLARYDLGAKMGELGDIECSKSTQVVNRHNNVLWDNALKFLLDAKSEEFTKTSSLISDLIGLRIEPKEFCTQFCEVVVRYSPYGGLDFNNYSCSQEKYSKAIIEEVCIHMSMIDCNANDKLSRQAKCEKKYQLSIRRMIRLWLENAVFQNNYWLERQVHMAQSWCVEELKSDAGRVTRSLIGPSKFLYHFFATTLQAISKGKDHGDECISTWKERAQLVTQSLFGGQIFKDDDFGASSGQIVATCQIMKESGVDVITQHVIMQDNLSGTYSIASAELDAENALIDEAEGVIGVKVAPTSIHVENMWGDGSYCSGVLEDYSYALNPSNNEQCATEALGDLEGAGFLHKNRGIKCSPLLLIALVSATETKGLTLTWNSGKGHVEIDPISARTLDSQVIECQILYTSKMKHLGEAVQWGMTQNGSTSSGMGIVQAQSAIYGAATQDQRDAKVGVRVLGSGVDVGCRIPTAKGKTLTDQSYSKLTKHYWQAEGGYEENLNTVDKRTIKQYFRQGKLPVLDDNYLVVHDDVKESHVSIYAIDEDKVEWITDIFLDGGVEECDKIFKEGLKGQQLTIERHCTDYAIVDMNVVSGLFAKFRNRIEKMRGNVIADSMTMVSELGSTSNNEWEHILGPLDTYSQCSDFWWRASSMQAIIYSRTNYSSGYLLRTRLASHMDLDLKMGYCWMKRQLHRDSHTYVHQRLHVTSRGRFSQPTSPLLSNPVSYWGGCKQLYGRR